MPFSDPSLPDSTEKVDAAPRLVGWKEIAAHLGKTERTVKRWGKTRGLPIHRVPGVAKTSVYAYPAELDQWLESASAFEPDSEPDIEEKPEIADTRAVAVAAARAPADSSVEALPRAVECEAEVGDGAGCRGRVCSGARCHSAAHGWGVGGQRCTQVPGASFAVC